MFKKVQLCHLMNFLCTERHIQKIFNKLAEKDFYFDANNLHG